MRHTRESDVSLPIRDAEEHVHAHVEDGRQGRLVPGHLLTVCTITHASCIMHVVLCNPQTSVNKCRQTSLTNILRQAHCFGKRGQTYNPKTFTYIAKCVPCGYSVKLPMKDRSYCIQKSLVKKRFAIRSTQCIQKSLVKKRFAVHPARYELKNSHYTSLVKGCVLNTSGSSNVYWEFTRTKVVNDKRLEHFFQHFV